MFTVNLELRNCSVSLINCNSNGLAKELICTHELKRFVLVNCTKYTLYCQQNERSTALQVSITTTAMNKGIVLKMTFSAVIVY